MAPFYEDNIRVELGEGYLIAPIETLEHIVSVYRSLAEDSEDPTPWNGVAQLIEDWTNNTGFYPEDFEDDYEELYEEEEVED